MKNELRLTLNIVVKNMPFLILCQNDIKSEQR
jgi:hypothetical protein